MNVTENIVDYVSLKVSCNNKSSYPCDISKYKERKKMWVLIYSSFLTPNVKAIFNSLMKQIVRMNFKANMVDQKNLPS